MSKSLQPHGMQHTGLPCHSLSPGDWSNSCQLIWWCYLTISSSATLFSFCLQSFPASIFPSINLSHSFFNESDLHIKWPKYWSLSFSISPPMNSQGWFPLELTGLVSLLSRVFSSTTIPKHQFFGVQPSLWSNSHIHTWLLEKSYLWLYRLLSTKWCLCFLIHCLDLS